MRLLRSNWFKSFRRSALVEGLRLWLILLGSNIVLLFCVFSYLAYQFYTDMYAEFVREMHALTSAYENGGRQELVSYAAAQYSRSDVRQLRYILVDAEDNRLEGTLSSWQASVPLGESWVEVFRATRELETQLDEQVDFIAVASELSDGNRLQLAHYVGNSRRVAEGIYRTIIIGVMVSVGLSFVVISVGSVNFLRRLRPLNKDIDIVKSGNLSHRLHVGEANNEMERLAAHINDMLDRIQELMDGVKQVSDNIAHDLRTPLTRLRNDLALYERGCSLDDRESVRKLIEEADQLIATFNALLRIARIELSETRREWNEIDLHELVGEVIDLYEPVAAEKIL